MTIVGGGVFVGAGLFGRLRRPNPPVFAFVSQGRIAYGHSPFCPSEKGLGGEVISQPFFSIFE